jgi:4-hydroxy-tetrahydrodipicolinate reductase
METIRFAIAGSGGRMGRTLIEAVLAAADGTLAAALDVAGSPMLGKDAGEALGTPCGVPIDADIDVGLSQADCLIDFTRPDGTMAHLDVCRRRGVHMVIGTTGLSTEQKLMIHPDRFRPQHGRRGKPGVPTARHGGAYSQ